MSSVAPSNYQELLTPAAVLRAAAEKLKPLGAWEKEAYWSLNDGEHCFSSYFAVPEDAICFCTMGAIGSILGVTPDEAFDSEAVRELGRAVGFVPDWNDAPARTQTEVVATLREVADAWEQANPGTARPINPPHQDSGETGQ